MFQMEGHGQLHGQLLDGGKAWLSGVRHGGALEVKNAYADYVEGCQLLNLTFRAIRQNKKTPNILKCCRQTYVGGVLTNDAD